MGEPKIGQFPGRSQAGGKFFDAVKRDRKDTTSMQPRLAKKA
jgi:hypothetical protein